MGGRRAVSGRQIPTDADIMRLRSAGGSLSIRSFGRTVVGLKLHREIGRSERLHAWIPLEILSEPRKVELVNRRRRVRGKPPVMLPSHPGLEAAGWQRAPNLDLLERSWAIESPADRDRLRHDIKSTLDILDADAGRPGRPLSVHHTSAVDEVDDVFFPALFLSAIGSVLGAVAGLLVAAFGSGLGSVGVILLGLAAALAGGFITGVVGFSPVIDLAARLPWLRTRPHAVWMTFTLIGPGLIAGLIAAYVTRASSS